MSIDDADVGKVVNDRANCARRRLYDKSAVAVTSSHGSSKLRDVDDGITTSPTDTYLYLRLHASPLARLSHGTPRRRAFSAALNDLSAYFGAYTAGREGCWRQTANN